MSSLAFAAGDVEERSKLAAWMALFFEAGAPPKAENNVACFMVRFLPKPFALALIFVLNSALWRDKELKAFKEEKKQTPRWTRQNEEDVMTTSVLAPAMVGLKPMLLLLRPRARRGPSTYRYLITNCHHSFYCMSWDADVDHYFGRGKL